MSDEEKSEKEAKRDLFVETAERLFKEHGVVDTTINAIVKELDVAKGLFYYYFKSKDDVIDAISDKYTNDLKLRVQKILNTSEDYETQLKVYIHNTIDSFQKLWRQLDNKDGDIDLTILSTRTMEEAKECAKEGLVKILKRGNELGIFHIANPQAQAQAVIGAISEMAHNTQQDLQEIETIITNFIQRTKENKYHE